MRRKLTITVAEDVYEGLHRVIGPRHISQFLETLARPHVLLEDMDAAYAAMAGDESRESEALEWAEGTLIAVAELFGAANETR
ncbi:MAG: addiction module antitoxin [Actinobacteria bacterium]|nr:addiction module antitoxin [Actinomycetota bacterium]